ncbi:MAG: hypothetical protein A2096_13740 [Spirochaetes bacterium GWF1_41_5]|nr:MAG: hypothetical protein A2096_13740 [Spirochaetes bacterium GWF1_41_5]HBE03070.1 GIY-YIG nuclease family protein [Spirochaetia bacterium]
MPNCSIYYIYVLECRKNFLYCGITTDISRRFNEHVSGKRGARFTRAFKPGRILKCWKTGNRSDAQRIEAFFKSMNKKEKLECLEKPAVFLKKIKKNPGLKIRSYIRILKNIS